MDTRKIKPGPWGDQACDKLMEINQGSLIKAIIKYVCWSCIDWETVWVTAALTSGAVNSESWWVGLLKHPLCHLSYPASSLGSSGTLRVTCHDTVEMIHKMISGFTQTYLLHCVFTAGRLMTSTSEGKEATETQRFTFSTAGGSLKRCTYVWSALIPQ